tara:strand:- start:1195 stop:1422 length:228 start_codon:yes stop_codon:yes gene_type:complete
VVVGVRLTQTLLDQHQLLGDLVVEDHIQVMEVLEIHLQLIHHKVMQVQMETQLLVKNQVVVEVGLQQLVLEHHQE